MTPAETTLPGAARAASRRQVPGRARPRDEVRAGEPVVDRLIGDQPARWWALGGSWLAVAFSVGFGLYVNSEAQGQGGTFANSLMATIPHYFVWMLASPPIYRAMLKTIEGTNRLLWSARLLGWSALAYLGSTAMSYASYATRRDLTPGLDQLISIYFMPPAGPPFHAMNFSILVLALVAFAVIRGLRLRDHALWEGAQAELHGARLETQLAEARLLALQAQINPHFLLNSLNAIAGLVQIGERERAFDAIGRLGELLQLALRNGADLNMTLGHEMNFLQRYLGLCVLRFDSKFRYCVSVPESLRALRIPALIVQPLIENAIRHGMQPSRALHVDIRAYEQDAAVVIEIEDDGCGIPGAVVESLPAGHGLANVSERLRLFYGSAGRLELEPRLPHGTRARITCPN